MRTAFRPALFELEPRDVPAWFSVTAPSPAEGTVGVTDATHTGSLVLNPAYEAVGGVVTVWADTAVAAAVEAIRGTITVTLGGESVDQVFGPTRSGRRPTTRRSRSRRTGRPWRSRWKTWSGSPA